VNAMSNTDATHPVTRNRVNSAILLKKIGAGTEKIGASTKLK